MIVVWYSTAKIGQERNASIHNLISRSYAFIPGHALHEKGLQRQKGVGPLVGSQERRALLVPVINRLQTGYKPLVNR